MIALVLLGHAAGCRGGPRSEAPAASHAAPPVVSGSRGEAVAVTGRFQAMGTSLEITAWTDRADEAREAMVAAHAEIRRLEALMTTWNDRSEVARINASAGGAPVAVSPEVVDVLRAARRIHDASEGVFDITYYALKGLWRFDQDAAPIVPSDEAIRARLPLVDGSCVEIDERARTVRLPVAGMAINLGGIAKGYAVDRAAALLAERGVRDVIVQLGGDMIVRGRKGRAPWRVGIRDPRGPAGSFFAIASIEDAAFSTAGDYERSFVKDGVRYHHVIDPRTGKPATACRSVTIFAPDALTADTLDDAVFILGPEKGARLVEESPGAGAVIVDKDNRVTITKRLKDVVDLLRPPTDGV